MEVSETNQLHNYDENDDTPQISAVSALRESIEKKGNNR